MTPGPQLSADPVVPPTPSGRSPRTLIADDQADVREALSLLLKRAGHETCTAASPEAVLRALEAQQFDVVLMDLNYSRDTTSGREGLDLLPRIRAVDRALPVVVMTAWGSVELAVGAMRRGVGDIVEKPWENARLLTILQDQIDRGRRERRRQARRAGQAGLRSEIAAARRVQRGLLPRRLPSLDGYSLAGYWRPAGSVGGDSFDVLDLGDGCTGLCIADVVGKGVPAALLMSNLQAAVRALAGPRTAPRDLCERLNRLLLPNTPEASFITFFYGLLDVRRRRLTYAGAGHPPPLLMRRDGSCERLRERGRVLGVLPDWRANDAALDLLPGDRLVLFTDGVTEARNARDEEFGEGRLIAVAREARRLEPEELNGRIVAAIDAFCPAGPQDDATLLTLAVRD